MIVTFECYKTQKQVRVNVLKRNAEAIRERIKNVLNCSFEDNECFAIDNEYTYFNNCTLQEMHDLARLYKSFDVSHYLYFYENWKKMGA